MAKSDHAEYIAFARRILKALEPRIGSADPDDLAELIHLRHALDSAIDAAVRGQRANGFTWAEIARPLGISRQAVQKKWAKLDEQHDPSQRIIFTDVDPDQ